MANPLVRLGVKLAVKGGKKLAKKIKTKRNSMNSTDNMTKGPIDKSIKNIGNKTKKPSINDPLPKVFNTRPGESSFRYFQRTGKLPERIKGK